MSYRNTGDVHIRQDRVCAVCGKTIVSGTLCRTLNRRRAGRKWVCMSCVDRVDSLEKLQNRFKCNFDDEGYAQACLEAESDCKDQLAEVYNLLGVEV